MKRLRIALPFLTLLIWQLLSSTKVLPYYKIPSPMEIIVALGTLIGVGLPPGYRLHGHVLESLLRVGYGFSIATMLGVPLGILMGWSKNFYLLATPFVEVVRPIPPLAWIPIAIVWFGIGVKSASFIIFLGAFFPVLLNTIAGVLSVDHLLIEASRTLGAKKKDIFLKVLFPGAMPNIFTGMRIGLGIGWMTLVAAEFTGVKSGYGLGYLIMIARDVQRPDEIVAGMIVIGLIGFFLDGLFKINETRVLKWR